TRCARVELPAAHPAHQEGARRSAVRAGAEGARHGSGRREGLPGVLAPDGARARVAQRGEQGVHFLHAQEVRALALSALLACHGAAAADATFSVKVLTPETALKAARAAFE